MAGLIQGKKIGGVIMPLLPRANPTPRSSRMPKPWTKGCRRVRQAVHRSRGAKAGARLVRWRVSLRRQCTFSSTLPRTAHGRQISGENELRRLYAQPGLAQKNVGYTVVRPGGLTKDPPLGVAAVELNQGDTKSGRIARSDVAAICIESLASPAAFDTTFECYYGDTAKELDGLASNAKGIATGTKEATDAMFKERRADSWPKLFEGLEQDV